jgi:hypothetical protein
MSYSPLAIKRSNVLGKIYPQCDSVESIPVYMNDKSGEHLGFVDESMGHYADAFVFHLAEDVCKHLSMSHYDYAFGFEYSKSADQITNKTRIKLNQIFLVGKKPLINKKTASEKAVFLAEQLKQ